MNYQSYKTFRVFGNKASLPDHLNRTDLQVNDPFIMVSLTGFVFSPDLSEHYFDYNGNDENPKMLQLSEHDIENYFVPVNVTTVYNGQLFEWRNVNDLIVSTRKMKLNLSNDLSNTYDQFIKEYFTKGNQND